MNQEKKQNEITWVEFNELVYNRENPRFIYKEANADSIFSKIKKGNLIYFKRDNLIWLGEVKRVSGKIGLDVKII